VLPLLDEPAFDELVLVMLSPWSLGTTPRGVDEIRARTMEIAFTATHLREMQWIAKAFTTPTVAWRRGAFERRVQRTHWHVIDGNDHLATLPSDSKMIAHRPLLERLCEAGRQRTLAWLQHHGGSLGRRSSADLQRLFGGHQAPAG
jgi:NTE family protein